MTIETAARDFHRDGFVLVPAALEAEPCVQLVAAIQDVMADRPDAASTRWLRSQMHTSGPLFEQLIDRSPVIELAEHLLAYEPGDLARPATEEQRRRCHVLNITSMVTRPGDPGHHWHIDDVLLMPRPADVPWDDRIPFPVLIISAMYYLTDVTADLGPTELVPGSHKSGRKPPPHEPEPVYEGRRRHAVLARAGDCLLFHSQVWHHALPNTSSSARYVQQVHYGARFIAQRFFPFPNYHMPASFLDRLTPRRQQLMGMHPCLGQYC